MNEMPIETKLIIGFITLIVFYFIVKQTIKNISSTNDDGDTIIDLYKTSRRGREEKKSE